MRGEQHALFQSQLRCNISSKRVELDALRDVGAFSIREGLEPPLAEAVVTDVTLNPGSTIPKHD